MQQRWFWLKAASLLLICAQGSAAFAQKAIDLPGERFFPESITSDGKGIAYVPSAQGGVYKVILATGKVTPWIAPGAYGSASVFSVLVDPARKLLWTCNNDLTAVGIPIAGADKGSTIKAFDLATGKGKISLQLPGANAFCNDMTFAKDGTVYAADSNRSHILRWKPGAAALEDWFFDAALADPANNNGGLDGIVFAPDGTLIVNNWRLNRLARVAIAADGKPGKMTIIQTSRPLEVPDGMRLIDGMRIAVAEGTGKIAIVTIAGDSAHVQTIADGLSSAAGVTIEKGVVWHVAGELSYVFNPQKRMQKPPLPFRVSPAPLP